MNDTSITNGTTPPDSSWTKDEVLPLDKYLTTSTQAIVTPNGLNTPNTWYEHVIETKQTPVPKYRVQDIDQCKYDADSKTLFAYMHDSSTTPYPLTPNSWPMQLRLIRSNPGDKFLLIDFDRVTSAFIDDNENVYALYRNDTTHHVGVRLYHTEKLRDYYFAMYRATKKNPQP
jgi:hypothetical protein